MDFLDQPGASFVLTDVRSAGVLARAKTAAELMDLLHEEVDENHGDVTYLRITACSVDGKEIAQEWAENLLALA